MKNRILNLLCIFIVIATSLSAQPHCKHVGINYVCNLVTPGNVSEVRVEIMDFYMDKYQDPVLDGVMSYEDATFEIDELMNRLFSNSGVSDIDCENGNPTMLDTGLSSDVEENSDANTSYDVFLRWDDYLPESLRYYSAYLDFTTNADPIVDSLIQNSPRMIFNVPIKAGDKLYALNTRCEDNQSSYSIIIIDKHITSLPAGENSEMVNEDEKLNLPKASLKAFPNPVFEEKINLNIYLSKEQKGSISLIEGSTGKLIKTIVAETVFPKGHTFQSIHLNDYSSGVYYLMLQTDEERIVKKIIKI